MRKAEYKFYGCRKGSYDEQKVRDRHYRSGSIEDLTKWAADGRGVQVIPSLAGLVVVDIDLKNMPDANPDLYEFVLGELAMAGVAVAKTRGGYHIYLKNPYPDKRRKKFHKPHLMPFGLAVSEIHAGTHGVNLPLSAGRVILTPHGEIDPTKDLDKAIEWLRYVLSDGYRFVAFWEDYLDDPKNEPLACIKDWVGEDERVMDFIPQGMRNTVLNKIAQRIPKEFPYWDICEAIVRKMCNPPYDDTDSPYRPMDYEVQNKGLGDAVSESGVVIPEGIDPDVFDDKGKVVRKKVAQKIAEYLYENGCVIAYVKYPDDKNYTDAFLWRGLVKGAAQNITQNPIVVKLMQSCPYHELIAPPTKEELNLIERALREVSCHTPNKIVLSNLVGRLSGGIPYIIAEGDDGEPCLITLQDGKLHSQRLSETKYALQLHWGESAESHDVKIISLAALRDFVKDTDKAVEVLKAAAKHVIPEDYDQLALFSTVLPVATGFSNAGVYLVGEGGVGKSFILGRTQKLFGGVGFPVVSREEELNKALAGFDGNFFVLDEVDKFGFDERNVVSRALFQMLSPDGYKFSARRPYDRTTTVRTIQRGAIVAGNAIMNVQNPHIFAERFVRIVLAKRINPKAPQHLFEAFVDNHASEVAAAAFAVYAKYHSLCPENWDKHRLRDPFYVSAAYAFAYALGVVNEVDKLLDISRTVSYQDPFAEAIALAIDEATQNKTTFKLKELAETVREAMDFSEKDNVVLKIRSFLTPKGGGTTGIEKVNTILRNEYKKELVWDGVKLYTTFDAHEKTQIYHVRYLDNPEPPTTPESPNTPDEPNDPSDTTPAIPGIDYPAEWDDICVNQDVQECLNEDTQSTETPQDPTDEYLMEFAGVNVPIHDRRTAFADLFGKVIPWYRAKKLAKPLPEGITVFYARELDMPIYAAVGKEANMAVRQKIQQKYGVLPWQEGKKLWTWGATADDTDGLA